MKTSYHISKLSAIKKLLFIWTLMSFVVPTTMASDWQTISKEGAELESTDPEWPIILNIKPASNNSCAVDGMFLGHYMCSLKGEVWPSGDEMKIKVKGNVSENIKLMIYGTLSYRDAEIVKIDGTLSVTANGSGHETSCLFYMKDKSVKIIWDWGTGEETPWQKAINKFKSLLGTKILDKGKPVTINKSQIDGECNYCELNDWNFNYKLNDGITGSFLITQKFAAKLKRFLVTSFCSEDFSGKLYVCASKKHKVAFFLVDGKLYSINDSLQATILNQLDNSLHNFPLD